MDTIELTINLKPREPWSGILIAQLSELGFDGFVETKKGIQAYAPDTVDVDEALKHTSLEEAKGLTYSIEKNVIPHQNWNEQWESDFHPVQVENYATIIAPFHTNVETKGLKVVIQPQMSFGTGHHQTTWMMTKLLFEQDSLPADVLDMGTGTGVLAIVAEKLEAENILAIDIEEWSAENAELNATLNDCSKIQVECGGKEKIPNQQFGLILANINKNILKDQMAIYSESLVPKGVLMLSGFFESDVPEMEEVCNQNGLELVRYIEKEGWAAMELIKK